MSLIEERDRKTEKDSKNKGEEQNERRHPPAFLDRSNAMYL